MNSPGALAGDGGGAGAGGAALSVTSGGGAGGATGVVNGIGSDGAGTAVGMGNGRSSGANDGAPATGVGSGSGNGTGGVLASGAATGGGGGGAGAAASAGGITRMNVVASGSDVRAASQDANEFSPSSARVITAQPFSVTTVSMISAASGAASRESRSVMRSRATCARSSSTWASTGVPDVVSRAMKVRMPSSRAMAIDRR